MSKRAKLVIAQVPFNLYCYSELSITIGVRTLLYVIQKASNWKPSMNWDSEIVQKQRNQVLHVLIYSKWSIALSHFFIYYYYLYFSVVAPGKCPMRGVAQAPCLAGLTPEPALLMSSLTSHFIVTSHVKYSLPPSREWLVLHIFKISLFSLIQKPWFFFLVNRNHDTRIKKKKKKNTRTNKVYELCKCNVDEMVINVCINLQWRRCVPSRAVWWIHIRIWLVGIEETHVHQNGEGLCATKQH